MASAYNMPLWGPAQAPGKPSTVPRPASNLGRGGSRAAEPELPPDFLWGAATSAHQVEGWNTASDWWAAEQAGEVPAASGPACDHRRRFPADLDLLAAVGLNAYRFSVEWARLQPEPGTWRDDELAVYARMVDACLARGIRPLVTLHHFTLPAWVAGRGGWLWSGVVPAFAAYARRVVAALGDRVDLFATLNEPVVLALNAYLGGLWPPRRRSPLRALTAARRQAAAHREAYAAIHAERPAAQVGVAYHVVAFRPLEVRRPADRALAALVAWAFNDWWLDAVRPRLDWVGVNYYTTHYCSAGGRPGRWLPSVLRCRERPQTEMGWEVHPAGLRLALRRVARLGLPIYITENGIATTDDRQRCRFLRAHLLAAARAIREGADLRGYFYWSLLDNFEWAEGYSMHFGLIGVDRQSLARRPRPSLAYLGAMARAGRVLREPAPDGPRQDRGRALG
jgi:beta-glucosidase